MPQSNHPSGTVDHCERELLSVVIVSCDKYRDTWSPLLSAFDEFWSDCPYPVWLMTNQCKVVHSNVRTLSVGPDIDWSSNLLRALDVVRSSHVLLWLDDVFPCALIDSARVGSVLSFAVKTNAAFVRLRPEPKPDVWRVDGFGELGDAASYRVSVFATIWRVDVLRDLIRCGETPWQFELRGTERAKSVPGFFCTRDHIFSHVHGIEKGLWLRHAVKWLAERGHAVDQQYRRQMNGTEHFRYCVGRLKQHLMSVVPEKHRKAVLHVVRRCYLFLGLRRVDYYRD